MTAKFQVFLITCGLSAFNAAGIYGILKLLENGQNGVEIPLILGAIIITPTLLFNILCALSLLLPWPDDSQRDYSEQNYKQTKSKLKKSLGWRVFKEIIDIID